MASFVFFHEVKNYLGDNTVDFNNHSFKWRLTNVAPTADTDTGVATFTAVTGGSYADVAATTTWEETGSGTGVWRLKVSANPSWTAVSTDFSTFRYVVFFDDTHASKAVVGYYDVGSQTIAAGSTFTLNLTDANKAVIELS